MQFSLTAQHTLNRKANCFTLSNSVSRNISNFFLPVYLIIFALLTAKQSIKIITTGRIQGSNIIHDTTFKPTDPVFTSLQGLIHIGFCSGMILIAGCSIRLRQCKHQVVEIVNLMINLNLKLQDQFKQHLQRNRQITRAKRIADFFVIALAMGTILVPCLFGLFSFQPYSPVRRIFHEVLEVEIKLTWNFLPYMLVMNYFVLCCNDVVFLIDLMGILIFQCTSFWLYLLKPEELIGFENGVHANFNCVLGCVQNDKKLIKFYRELQVIYRIFNQIFAHVLISVHHACFLVICVIGSFLCIKHYDKLLLPGVQLGPIVVVASLVIELYETIFISGAENKSVDFSEKIWMLVRKEKRKLKGVEKEIQSFWPLRGYTAYPFYKLRKDNCLEFGHSVFDNLVTVLVTFR